MTTTLLLAGLAAALATPATPPRQTAASCVVRQSHVPAGKIAHAPPARACAAPTRAADSVAPWPHQRTTRQKI